MKQANIQQAIYDELLSLGHPVYDHVPQVSAYPYIVIGDDTSIPFDTDESVGSESTLTIHVWSQYRGRLESKELLQEIYDKLNRADIAISGCHLVECVGEFQETYVESDGLTRHGVIRFRLIVEDINATLVTESGLLLETESGDLMVTQ
jgi:hypothetical protein